MGPAPPGCERPWAQVELESLSSGVWIALEQTEVVLLERDGPRCRIRDPEGLTVLDGTFDAQGVLRGAVEQEGVGGGSFELVPQVLEAWKRAKTTQVANLAMSMDAARRHLSKDLDEAKEQKQGGLRGVFAGFKQKFAKKEKEPTPVVAERRPSASMVDAWQTRKQAQPAGKP